VIATTEKTICAGVKEGNGGDHNQVRESAHDTMRGETESRPGTAWKRTNDDQDRKDNEDDRGGHGIALRARRAGSVTKEEVWDEDNNEVGIGEGAYFCLSFPFFA
jgi:hypothetical protein